ncbi:hypothetical protein V8C86DRAFT_2438258 [Haematococcus lacustris]
MGSEMDPVVWCQDPVCQDTVGVQQDPVDPVCQDPVVRDQDPVGQDPVVWCQDPVDPVCQDPVVWCQDPVVRCQDPVGQDPVDPVVWCQDPVCQDPVVWCQDPVGQDPVVWCQNPVCQDPVVWCQDPVDPVSQDPVVRCQDPVGVQQDPVVRYQDPVVPGPCGVVPGPYRREPTPPLTLNPTLALSPPPLTTPLQGKRQHHSKPPTLPSSQEQTFTNLPWHLGVTTTPFPPPSTHKLPLPPLLPDPFAPCSLPLSGGWWLPMSDHMLLEEYAAVKAEVTSRLAAVPFVAITVDGWSQKQYLVWCVAGSQETFMLDCVHTEADSVIAVYIAIGGIGGIGGAWAVTFSARVFGGSQAANHPLPVCRPLPLLRAAAPRMNPSAYCLVLAEAAARAAGAGTPPSLT